MLTELKKNELDAVDDAFLKPTPRGRWRLQLWIIAKPAHKFDLGISVFSSTDSSNIDTDELSYFCPRTVPPGYPSGCRFPLPPHAHAGGFFACPHCGLVGPEEILSEQIMHLNTTVDKAARYVHDAWLRCNHDADIYLVRAKRKQALIRLAGRDAKVSEIETDRHKRDLETERVLYKYDSLIKDAKSGEIMHQLKAFLGA